MLNNGILLLLFTNFSIISLILWLVTFLECYINKNTQHYTKTTVYECGFWTINKNVFPISLNTILLLLFVIIYEVELILLTPLLVTSYTNSFQIHTLVLVVIYFVIITLLLDVNLKKITWVY